MTSAAISLLSNRRRQPNRVPYGVIAPVDRPTTFRAFFRSGSQKLADWSATLAVFQHEYGAPLFSIPCGHPRCSDAGAWMLKTDPPYQQRRGHMRRYTVSGQDRQLTIGE